MTEAAEVEPLFPSEGWIEAHNARVAAFRKEHFPPIHALTDEQCERVHARWIEPGTSLAANTLALEFRAEFGMTWPEEHAVAIGVELLRTVLARLDKHDPDFRPWPRIEDMGAIGGGRLWYLPAKGRYRVEVGKRREEFRAAHVPRFGIDSSDRATAAAIADRLAAASSSLS